MTTNYIQKKNSQNQKEMYFTLSTVRSRRSRLENSCRTNDDDDDDDDDDDKYIKTKRNLRNISCLLCESLRSVFFENLRVD
jgi:hypothetical protein